MGAAHGWDPAPRSPGDQRVTLPDPAEGRATPHAGHYWAWVVDPNWQVSYAEKRCRWMENRKGCGAPAVAKFWRPGPRRSSWWHYCGDHLFGRIIHDGQVWSAQLVPDADA